MGNGGKQEMKKEDTEMMLRIFETERAGYQCHLDKDCFIVRNSYTADKHFVYLLYFYLITLLT